MSSNQDIMEKRNAFTDCEEKYICKVRRNDHNYRQVYEYDKKLKREIANSNERRRMQSINMGFETLKQLLPMTMEGEKLSKASILQFTAKYIQSLIARLTTLEKEVASYKKTMLTSKDKVPSSKSSTVMQEQNRKRRLNSCTVDYEIAQIESHESNLDISPCANFIMLNQDSALINCHTAEKTPGSLEHLVAAIEQVEGEKFYDASTSDEIRSQIIKDEATSDCSSIVELNNDSFDISEPPPNPVSPVKLVLNSHPDSKRQSTISSNSSSASSSNTNNSNSSSSNNNTANSSVMKPTISPYTEKIILAVSEHPHMFENRVSNYSLNMAPQSTYQIMAGDKLIDPAGFNRHLGGGSHRIPSSIPHKYLHRPDVALQKNHTL